MAVMPSCSHWSWMTPIFANKWPPRDMYPIFVWKEGFMSLLKDWELTKWPPFFLAFKLKSSLKDPFFYSPHQMTPYFSFVLTERPHIYSVTDSPKDPYFWGRVRTSPSLPYVIPPGHWCGVRDRSQTPVRGPDANIYRKKFSGPPFRPQKNFRAPPFSGQPHRKACKLNF